MTGERNETLTTGRDLRYPMVDLFTGGTVMPLMFVNAVTTWYLLSLTAPWAFMEAWLKARETKLASYNPTVRHAVPRTGTIATARDSWSRMVPSPSGLRAPR